MRRSDIATRTVPNSAEVVPGPLAAEGRELTASAEVAATAVPSPKFRPRTIGGRCWTQPDRYTSRKVGPGNEGGGVPKKYDACVIGCGTRLQGAVYDEGMRGGTYFEK